MDDLKHIVHQQLSEYGSVKVKLSGIMDSRGITRNHLRTLTGIKYDVIDRYYKGCDIARVDLDFLARVCFVLNCDLCDLLEYIPPENK